MTQSNQSQVFIEFQEFLLRRYENKRRCIIELTRELRQAQEWNSQEIEATKALEVELRDEEWTNMYNQLRECEEELEREDEELEKRWNENEMRKPNMVG